MLNGKNFLDWERNLRIVLRSEHKGYVLDEPLPTEEPPVDASHEDHEYYEKFIDDDVEVTCLMLATMSSDLQKAVC